MRVDGDGKTILGRENNERFRDGMIREESALFVEGEI